MLIIYNLQIKYFNFDNTLFTHTQNIYHIFLESAHSSAPSTPGSLDTDIESPTREPFTPKGSPEKGTESNIGEFQKELLNLNFEAIPERIFEEYFYEWVLILHINSTTHSLKPHYKYNSNIKTIFQLLPRRVQQRWHNGKKLPCEIRRIKRLQPKPPTNRKRKRFRKIQTHWPEPWILWRATGRKELLAAKNILCNSACSFPILYSCALFIEINYYSLSSILCIYLEILFLKLKSSLE